MNTSSATEEVIEIEITAAAHGGDGVGRISRHGLFRVRGASGRYGTRQNSPAQPACGMGGSGVGSYPFSVPRIHAGMRRVSRHLAWRALPIPPRRTGNGV